MGPGAIDASIATQIRVQRARHRISQIQLRDFMNSRGHKWHAQTVSQIETDIRRVRAAELPALAEALHLTVGQLLEPGHWP